MRCGVDRPLLLMIGLNLHAPWKTPNLKPGWPLDSASLCGVQGCAQEHLDFGWHGREALVFGQALMIAKINLLSDHGKFETRERDVKCDL